jgi:predicted Zn-dependent protease
LIKHDVQVVVAATFAYLEKRFAGEPPMLASIAKALYDLGTFDAAERVCSTALEKEPHNVQLLLLKGRTLARQNKVGEAAEAMGEALSLQPENIRVLQALVPLQFKLARWDAAEQNAQCLIRLSPGNPWGHSFLATVLKRKRLRSEALIHARRAAELEPKREQFRRQVEELSSPPSARPS